MDTLSQSGLSTNFTLSDWEGGAVERKASGCNQEVLDRICKIWTGVSALKAQLQPPIADATQVGALTKVTLAD